MPHKTNPKARMAKRRTATAKRPAKRSSRGPSRKASIEKAARPHSFLSPRLSREVVEEVLVHSARSSSDERLSDTALSEIAICADLEPSRVLEAHRQLCEAADDSDVTVLRVVELWDPCE
ncbi:MAG: hypothetical protein ACLQJR_06330 [Stellaceae bacterium]